MRSLALVLSLCFALAAAPAEAKIDPSDHACFGYEMCQEIDGFALFCVKYKERWVCGQCEACGNGPWGRDLS